MDKNRGPSKADIKRIIENRSYREFLELVIPLMRKGIHFLTNRLSLDTVIVEQAVEDSIIKAMLRIDDFDESRGKFSTWLFSIMYHRAIDLKRKGILNTLSIEEMLERGKEIPVEDTTYFVDNEEKKQPYPTERVEFYLAFYSLSSNDQEIVQHILKGYSNLDAADELGISNLTYRKRKERALKRFKKILVQYPFFKKFVE